MSQPFVLTYARHFGLTKDYTATTPDLSRIFDRQDLPATRSTRHEHDEQTTNLLQTFESAAQDHISLANDDPLILSPDVLRFLEACTAKKTIDLNGLIHHMLPNPRSTRQHKLRVPLLVAGGGDVRKDVRRVRRGIDLNHVLEDILYEETGSYEHVGYGKSSTTAAESAEIIEMVQDQLLRATQTEIMDAPRSTILYLCQILPHTMMDSDVYKCISDMLPKTSKPIQRLPVDIREDEYAVDVGDEPVVGATKGTPELDASSATDDTFVTKEEGLVDHDLLTCVDINVNKGLQRSLGNSGKETETDSLLRQYTNHDFGEHEGNDFTLIQPREQPVHIEEPLAKRQKLLRQNSRACHESNQHLLSAHNKLKIAVPQVEDVQHTSPDLNLDALLRASGMSLSTNTSSDIKGQNGVRDVLPFTIPPMQEVVKEPILTNAAREKFFEPPKKSISSDRLLWKEPGIRVLDKNDEDNKDLNPADFELYKWKADMFLETKAEDLSQANGSYFFSKQEPDGNGKGYDCRPNCPPWKGLEVDNPGTIRYDDDVVKVEPGIARPLKSTSKPPTRYTNLFLPPEASIEATPVSSDAKISQKEASVLPIKKRRFELPTISSEILKNNLFASDCLGGFLDLRGKQFKTVKLTPAPHPVEIVDDPIESAQQTMQAGVEELKVKADRQTQTENEALAQQESVPPIEPLKSACTIILNNKLLQTKPLLIQFLERSVSSNLTLIYRDLDGEHHPGPDIILNPTCALLIVNLQSLSQRPLPGGKSNTSLSKVHDQIAWLAPSYTRIIVLTHYAFSNDAASQMRMTSAIAAFTSFCQSISEQDRQMIPIRLACHKASSTSEVVNAWVWRSIGRYGYSMDASRSPGPPPLLQDETLSELFLVRAGLNQFAAQVVVGSLHRKPAFSSTVPVNDVEWGLRQHVAMSAVERINMFEHKIGRRAIERLNHALEASLK